MEIEELPELLKELWGKFPPAAKYLILCGVVLMASLWLDSRLSLGFYDSLPLRLFQSFNSKQAVLFFALLFILIPPLVLILERIWINLKIIYYKARYPLRI